MLDVTAKAIQHAKRGTSSPVRTAEGNGGISLRIERSSLPSSMAGRESKNLANELSRAQEQSESRLVSTKGHLTISACGRTVFIEKSLSLLDMQVNLQKQLNMDGQSFQFFDVAGNALVTDGQVQEAVAKGNVPICANLTDASIHYIENRREELAQMQWKLVRDQMSGSEAKMSQLCRQTSELHQTFEQVKADLQALVERVRGELLKSIETGKSITQADLRQLGERINGVAQLVSGERNKREVAVQSADKNIQLLRDHLDAERSARRQDLAMHHSVVQDLKSQLDAERSCRQALEERHGIDMRDVGDRIDEVARQGAEMCQDLSTGYKKAHGEVTTSLQQCTRQVLKLSRDAESSTQQANVRLDELEHRCASLDSRLVEAANRHATSLDRLVERHEKVSEAVASLRLEDKQHQGQVQSTMEKVKALETTIANAEDETRELVQKERELRDDHVRRTQQGFLLEHSRQIRELERKLGERLERESYEREQNLKSIIDEVSKTIEVDKVTRAIDFEKEVTRAIDFEKEASTAVSVVSGSTTHRDGGVVAAQAAVAAAAGKVQAAVASVSPCGGHVIAPATPTAIGGSVMVPSGTATKTLAPAIAAASCAFPCAARPIVLRVTTPSPAGSRPSSVAAPSVSYVGAQRQGSASYRWSSSPTRRA